MDKINYNPDILSCLANLSNDEVFTPPDTVNKMLDLLPKHLFLSKNTTFLDPACKSGVFLREIAKRLNEGLKKEIPDTQQRINHIFKNQLFGISITELTSLLSRRSVYCSKKANGKYAVVDNFDNEQGNIIFNKIDHLWKNNKCEFCGASQSGYERSDDLETYAYEFIHTYKPEELFNMKFDVVIGNPPYQLSTDGYGAQAIPLYQKFVLQAKKLNPKFIVMITPSRWFSGGMGLQKFREEMLNDNRLRIIHDYLNSVDCFPGVEIKGGVSYFLWDRNNPGDCFVNTYKDNKLESSQERPLLEKNSDVFIRFNKAVSIYRKVIPKSEGFVNHIASSQKPFGLGTSFRGETSKFHNSLKVFQTGGIGYIKRERVTLNNDLIEKHKVFISKAYNAGDNFPHQVINKPIYGRPGSICTETYITFSSFNNEKEAQNFISYVSTKFFRFMTLIHKPSQDSLRNVYSFVPLQDFSKSISDQYLYEKYNLSNDEIKFIESMVRPMELNNE